MSRDLDTTHHPQAAGFLAKSYSYEDMTAAFAPILTHAWPTSGATELRVVLHNLGFASRGPFFSVTAEQLRDMTDVNVHGAFALARAAVEALLERYRAHAAGGSTHNSTDDESEVRWAAINPRYLRSHQLSRASATGSRSTPSASSLARPRTSSLPSSPRKLQSLARSPRSAISCPPTASYHRTGGSTARARRRLHRPVLRRRRLSLLLNPCQGYLNSLDLAACL